MYKIVHIILVILLPWCVIAQNYDVVIKNGHLIDPKNNLDNKMDVAIKDGTIAAVANSIPARQAEIVIDAQGMYITPGIIDMHTHNFYGTHGTYLADGFSALPPDGFTFRSGVTTVVDAGSSGWRNFSLFKEQTIDRSKTRVLAFLNIVGTGMLGDAHEQDLNDMDARLTALTAKRYPEIIRGIKVAHYSGPEWDPVERAVKAGDVADVPVMVDFGGVTPELSLETLFMEKLRPGDVFTHTFAHVNGRFPIVNEQGKLRPFVKDAQARGIIFDVGHGGGSFLFAQAVPAAQQGFKPTTISTDLHTGSMNGGMKDMANVMSKFINLDMSLYQVINASTWVPAQVIKREDLGHLTVGAVADLAVFSLQEGSFGFIDVRRKKMNGTRRLNCELTLKDGQVVYDLNGIASPLWDAKN